MQAFRRHPALAAALFVAAGAGVGYLAAKPATGELEKVLYQASTTLIFVALLGGAVKLLLEDEQSLRDQRRKQLLDDVQRLRDQRQEQARFVKQVLDDLKGVYDRVEGMRILISAHQSAATYGDEMRALIDCGVALKNIARALDTTSGMHDKDQLKSYVERMTAYVEALVDEFQRNYKVIADKQAGYEVKAKHARESGEDAPWNEPWEELKTLPCLAEFRRAPGKDENSYDRDFVEPLDAASKILRTELQQINTSHDAPRTPTRSRRGDAESGNGASAPTIPAVK